MFTDAKKCPKMNSLGWNGGIHDSNTGLIHTNSPLDLIEAVPA